MAPVGTASGRQRVLPGRRARHAWADNLKVVLVTGVIAAHVMIAWTGVGNWVVLEPPVREPLLSVLILLSGASLFGLALFFLLAGMFTPPSLQRKGLRRFLIDRALRLGVPLVFYVIVLSPFIEYVDADNADWDQGFVALTLHTVWCSWPLPPAWGPTWFLAMLLLFSTVYAVGRSVIPRTARPGGVLRGRHLAALGLVVTLTSYLIRIEVPLGAEVARLALGQAPGWVTGFALGVVGAERGWLDPIDPRLARWVRTVAWAGVAGVVVVLGGTALTGADVTSFAGGGTWQSLVLAVLEGALVVSMPLWLIDLFRRRWDHQGRLAREASRAAFAAFVLHQAVLVALVLLSRQVPWPPEVKWATVSLFGVLGSFALGALAVRLPGVSRVV